MALRPGHNRTGVHLLAVLAVEFSGLAAVAVVAKAFGPDLGVPIPEFLIARKRINQFCPLALPGRVFFAVENLIGHISGADHGTGHDAGYFLARPGHVEDSPVEGLHSGLDLLVAAGRLIRLRIVQHHQ